MNVRILEQCITCKDKMSEQEAKTNAHIRFESNDPNTGEPWAIDIPVCPKCRQNHRLEEAEIAFIEAHAKLHQ